MEGQVVICISDNFPVIKKYGGTGKEAERTPYIGEVLTVDEVLGEYFRFEKYDTEESFNWWKSDRFTPFNEDWQTRSAEELLKDRSNAYNYLA